MLNNRVFEQNINCQGIPMIITNYEGCHDIDVEFADGCIVKHTDYRRFKNGNVASYNFPGYLGIGYIGCGKYKSREEGEHTEEYIKWGSMLTRCYAEKYIKKANYDKCYVCNEWHNFQYFAEWYSLHKYEVPGDDLDIDKDIKYKGNKLYSPTTCILIPHSINTVICNRANDRGEFPIGVTKSSNGDKYIATCNIEKERIYLGTYDTPEKAFKVYKTAKENEILRLADLYKKYMPKEVYESVVNYKIEISD